MFDNISIPFTKVRMGRFLFLLVSMLLVLILRPFLEGLIHLHLLTSIFLSLILFSGTYALSNSKSTLITAVILACPIFLPEWLPFLLETSYFKKIHDIFGILFFAYTAVILLSHILKTQEITLDTISGAISVYFLIGFVWAYAYSTLETFQPGSFKIAVNMVKGIQSFSYYSFVTLTTLGYGDITPLSGPARSLSVLEAIVGQLFLAVLIGRLVGIYVSRSTERESN